MIVEDGRNCDEFKREVSSIEIESVENDNVKFQEFLSRFREIKINKLIFYFEMH